MLRRQTGDLTENVPLNRVVSLSTDVRDDSFLHLSFKKKGAQRNVRLPHTRLKSGFRSLKD